MQILGRGFESRTYLQFTPAKPDSFRAASQGLYATSLSESLARQTLQSGPKSPPTYSRVGLAWVRLASSLALLQRRQAMRGGSRFNRTNTFIGNTNYKVYEVAVNHLLHRMAGSIPALPTI